jgi:hypothetical protein
MNVLWFLLIFFAAAKALPAAVVAVVGGNPPVTLRSFSGDYLNSPPTVLRIGFFTNQNFNFPSGTCPAIEMLGHIQQYFVPLGEPGSPPGYGTPTNNTVGIDPQTHSIRGAITDVTFGTGTPNTVENGFVPRGTRFYLLVYEGGPVPTALGVYSATTWTVSLFSQVNTATLALPLVDTPQEVFVGWLSMGTGERSLGTSMFCPEPGAAVMALVSALVFAARPRR